VARHHRSARADPSQGPPKRENNFARNSFYLYTGPPGKTDFKDVTPFNRAGKDLLRLRQNAADPRKNPGRGPKDARNRQPPDGSCCKWLPFRRLRLSIPSSGVGARRTPETQAVSRNSPPCGTPVNPAESRDSQELCPARHDSAFVPLYFALKKSSKKKKKVFKANFFGKLRRSAGGIRALGRFSCPQGFFLPQPTPRQRQCAAPRGPGRRKNNHRPEPPSCDVFPIPRPISGRAPAWPADSAGPTWFPQPEMNHACAATQPKGRRCDEAKSC